MDIPTVLIARFKDWLADKASQGRVDENSPTSEEAVDFLMSTIEYLVDEKLLQSNDLEKMFTDWAIAIDEWIKDVEAGKIDVGVMVLRAMQNIISDKGLGSNATATKI